MENQDMEQYFVQKRDKLRQDIQERGQMNVGDLSTLINLDRAIAKEKVLVRILVEPNLKIGVLNVPILLTKAGWAKWGLLQNQLYVLRFYLR